MIVEQIQDLIEALSHFDPRDRIRFVLKHVVEEGNEAYEETTELDLDYLERVGGKVFLTFEKNEP